jgi:hypothetical protein
LGGAAHAPEASSPGPYGEGGFNNEAFYGAGDAAPAGGGGLGSRGLGYMAGRVAGRAVGLPELGGFVGEQMAGSSPMRMAALARGARVVQDYISDRMGAFARGAVNASEAASLPRSVAPTTLAMLNAPGADDRRQAMQARMNELGAYGDDRAVGDRATAGTAHFAQDAPDAAMAVSAKAVQVAAYLRDAAPQPLAQRSGLIAKPSYDLVSDRDVHRFAEMDAVLQDPLRIVDQMAKGHVPAPEIMKAVQEVYPETYQSIVAAFQAHIAKDPESVSWATTIRAGIAFGLSAHPSLDSANLATQQQAAAAPAPAAGGAPAPRRQGRSPAPPGRRAAGYASPADAQAAGDR